MTIDKETLERIRAVATPEAIKAQGVLDALRHADFYALLRIAMNNWNQLKAPNRRELDGIVNRWVR